MAVQDGGQSEWGNEVVFVKGVNSPEVQALCKKKKKKKLFKDTLRPLRTSSRSLMFCMVCIVESGFGGSCLEGGVGQNLVT